MVTEPGGCGDGPEAPISVSEKNNQSVLPGSLLDTDQHQQRVGTAQVLEIAGNFSERARGGGA